MSAEDADGACCTAKRGSAALHIDHSAQTAGPAAGFDSDAAAGPALRSTPPAGAAPWDDSGAFTAADDVFLACSAPPDDSCVPSTPCLDEPAHRPKLDPRSLPYNACVARPVSKTEIASAPAAQKATQAERGRLRSKRVWDETIVREWDDVADEARRAGTEASLGYLFGL